ncbi:MAG: hydrogenase 4 subunit B [Leptospirillia bacterium]
MTFFPSPLLLTLFTLLSLLLTGLAGAGLVGRRSTLAPLVFTLLSLESLTIGLSGFHALFAASDTRLILPGGIPGLAFHLRQDPLSGFFLLLLGGASAGVLLFSAGYTKDQPPLKRAQFLAKITVFLFFTGGVFLADDVYSFMVFWEIMAVASFFLILSGETTEGVRRASYLTLLLAHGGSLLILAAFALLATREIPSGSLAMASFSFEAMKQNHLASGEALLASLLFLLGFGAKAGVIPLHVWLPLAHPAAPAPASALLSGVMLKAALYGLIRALFDLVGLPQLTPSFGLLLLITGAFMALFGILHAILQSDTKTLLAYSSIENIGLILLGTGLGILYLKTGHPLAGTLALCAALYHALNHAFFKGLLFLGAGTMIHATGETNLNRMGGLFKKMPVSGALVLIGVLSISGIPPTNGFVSEWLLLQSTLQARDLSGTLQRSAVLFGAAILVLASALAAMGFLKFFGVGYLGQPRSDGAREAHECSLFEQLGMGGLAVGSLLLGLFPSLVLGEILKAVSPLTATTLPSPSGTFGWAWLLPLPPAGPSTSPLFLAILLILLTAPVLWLVLGTEEKKRRHSSPWGCGYRDFSGRSQATAESFAQPIRHFFPVFFSMKRHIPSPDDPDPAFRLSVEDPHWPFLYRPLFRLFVAIAEGAERVRSGRISIYLIYSFTTLILLLSVLRWH